MTPDQLRRLPKAELHLHLEGSIQPVTAAELAAANGVDLGLPPGADPSVLYEYDDLMGFLRIYGTICRALVTEGDFERVTFEMLGACAASGARHVEFMTSHHAHDGVDIAAQVAGIRAGIARARSAFGLTAFFSPGINREEGPEAAARHLDACLAVRCPEMIGIGLDYDEAPHPPEPFAPVFARARAEGLHVSAHAGEGGRAAHVRGAMDALGCTRIDHGYAIVEDPALMEEARARGILFTCCPTTTRFTTRWTDLAARDHPIRRMCEAGLRVTINSDDPPFFFTTLAKEYAVAQDALAFTDADIRASILAGIEGAWLPEEERTRHAATWADEIDAILAEGEPAGTVPP